MRGPFFLQRIWVFSAYCAFFGDLDAKLDYDPTSPAASTLEVWVNLNELVTNGSELDENLKSPDYFDVSASARLPFVAALGAASSR